MGRAAEAGGGRGGGGGGGGGGDGRKADTRRGVDVAPSGSEMRAFMNQFEDIAVNPPQVCCFGCVVLFFLGGHFECF